jgi:hypothetical protein
MAKGLARPSPAETKKLAPRWRETDNALLLVMAAGEASEWRNGEIGHVYARLTGLRRIAPE